MKMERQEVYTSYAIAKEIFDIVLDLKRPSNNEIYTIVAENLKNIKLKIPNKYLKYINMYLKDVDNCRQSKYGDWSGGNSLHLFRWQTILLP